MVEITLSNFIDGELVGPFAGSYLNAENPTTGEIYAAVPDSDADDVNAAVAAARRAFPSWAETTRAERSEILLQIAQLNEERADAFAAAESRDMGKSESLALEKEIPRAAANFKYFATFILHEGASAFATHMDGDFLNYTHHEPVGVAGLISPWNWPLYLLTSKIAPCIAFGNTCVVKASEMTSVTAWMLTECFKEAMLPPGVVNMVFGTGHRCGQPLVAHPHVDLVSFTGSTLTGKHVAMTAAPLFKKLCLEMGGKNAGVIFSDVNLREVVPKVVDACFRNQGEICLSLERIYVHTDIFDDFVHRFVAAAERERIGDPSNPNTTMGPLISKAHLNKVLGAVEQARSEGGLIHTGGHGLTGEEEDFDTIQGGHFMYPTVISGLMQDSDLTQEEIFGPVVCLYRFETEEDGIDLVNDTDYGLCSAIFTNDIRRANRMSRKLKVGTVWINCWLVRHLSMPYGGVKQSGLGTEGGKSSHQFFTNDKSVCSANY